MSGGGGDPHRRIRDVVSRIPRGRVATYGQVAILAGLPGQPRLVGYALSALPDDSGAPWQRVVNARGMVSPRSGGRESDSLQRVLLEREGIRFGPDGAIPLSRFRWTPRTEYVRLRPSETGPFGRSTGMKSSAASVEGYLRQLPEERRIVVSAVREVIRENIPAGYREATSGGGISWAVPLERYPGTHDGHPLCYVALAALKNHFSVTLTCAYLDSEQAQWLKAEFQKAGKKLDMGKSGLRFRKLDDLPLGVIGRAVASVKLKDFLARYEELRAQTKTRPRKPTVKKSPGTARAGKGTAKTAPGATKASKAGAKAAKRPA